MAHSLALLLTYLSAKLLARRPSLHQAATYVRKMRLKQMQHSLARRKELRRGELHGVAPFRLGLDVSTCLPRAKCLAFAEHFFKMHLPGPLSVIRRGIFVPQVPKSHSRQAFWCKIAHNFVALKARCLLKMCLDPNPGWIEPSFHTSPTLGLGEFLLNRRFREPHGEQQTWGNRRKKKKKKRGKSQLCNAPRKPRPRAPGMSCTRP